MELTLVQEHTHLVSTSQAEAEMDHKSHGAGTTIRGCIECNTSTYEPGWYATLLAASQERDLLVTIQEEADPAYS